MALSDESTWKVIGHAAETVLLPVFQAVCFGFFAFTLIIDGIVLYFQHRPFGSGFSEVLYHVAVQSLVLGLPKWTLVLGFLGLVFFSFWKKFVVFALVVLVAWLNH